MPIHANFLSRYNNGWYQWLSTDLAQRILEYYLATLKIWRNCNSVHVCLNPWCKHSQILPQLQTQTSKQKFTISIQAVSHFSCPILTNLQEHTAISSKGHNATSNAMMVFLPKNYLIHPLVSIHPDLPHTPTKRLEWKPVIWRILNVTHKHLTFHLLESSSCSKV